jgi:hypothetical protein
LDEIWELFEELGFFGVGQRRGAHVSVPKIGSRDGVFSFGGILGFYADLRRESEWGNLILVVFGGLLGVPRRSIEEEGTLCAFGGIYCVPG